jgi:hypothetical protein
MSIAGIQSNSLFDSYATISSGSRSTAMSATVKSGDDGVQSFLEYANETPAQRLFSNWLGSQHMTMDQYNNLPESEKEKLIEKFREQMEKELGVSNSQTGPATGSDAATGILISTSA